MSNHKTYYSELCPNEPGWVHEQLAREREELELEIKTLQEENASLLDEVNAWFGYVDPFDMYPIHNKLYARRAATLEMGETDIKI